MSLAEGPIYPEHLREQASQRSVGLLKKTIKDLAIGGKLPEKDFGKFTSQYRSPKSVFEVNYSFASIEEDTNPRSFEEFSITKRRIVDLTSIGLGREDEAYSYTITITDLDNIEDFDASVETHTEKHPKIASEPTLSPISGEIFDIMMYLKTPELKAEISDPTSYVEALEHLKKLAHEGLVQDLLNELNGAVPV